MNIENKRITVTVIKGISFICGVIILTWKVSVATLGVQQSIDSRFEAMDRKLENLTITMQNQNKTDKNTRNRDSATYINRFNAQDQKLDLIQNSLNRISPYNQRPITNN